MDSLGRRNHVSHLRAIVRVRPPERPVGFSRCEPHELLRWRQDRFRYPPYQYKDCYMMVRKNTGKLRYLTSFERDSLMGFGGGHTEPALSASAAKSSPKGYEDERMSLVGDALPANTFWLFAASAAERWVTRRSPRHYRQRLGMFPGELCCFRQDHTPRNFDTIREFVGGD